MNPANKPAKAPEAPQVLRKDLGHGESVSVEKIANGFLVRHAKNHPTKGYEETKTFSATPPKVSVGAAASVPKPKAGPMVRAISHMKGSK
jgi:hypothetical protein